MQTKLRSFVEYWINSGEDHQNPLNHKNHSRRHHPSLVQNWFLKCYWWQELLLCGNTTWNDTIQLCSVSCIIFWSSTMYVQYSFTSTAHCTCINFCFSIDQIHTWPHLTRVTNKWVLNKFWYIWFNYYYLKLPILT